MPLHGSSTSCSPSSIALARTTSSSAVSRATLPISLRYIRTGSSMPIMSALIASSSSAVGSSTSSGSSFAGASSGSFESTRLAVLADDLDADVAVVAVGEPVGAARARRRRRRPRRPRRRQDDLGGAEAAGRRAWPPRGRPWPAAGGSGRLRRAACRADRTSVSSVGAGHRSVTRRGDVSWCHARTPSLVRSGGPATCAALVALASAASRSWSIDVAVGRGSAAAIADGDPVGALVERRSLEVEQAAVDLVRDPHPTGCPRDPARRGR